MTALSYNCSTSVILTKWLGIEGCSMQTRTTGNDEKQLLIAFFKSSSVWPENDRWWNSLWLDSWVTLTSDTRQSMRMDEQVGK